MSKKQHTQFTDADFRAELKKLLPGYKWTVTKSTYNSTKFATGTLSAGFNRLSTLDALRGVSTINGCAWYEIDARGYGTRSEKTARGVGNSLAQAVRMMQDELWTKARKYQALHDQVEQARKHADKEATP